MNISKYTILLLAMGSLGLVNCGGGGGGGDSGVVYTGNTSPAVLTDANTQEFIEMAIVTSGPSTSVGILSIDERPGSTSGTTRDFTDSLASAANSIIDKLPSQNPTSSEIISESDTIAGTCGGQFTFSIRYDDQTGDFSGTISFSDYDECEGILNGRSSFSGLIDVSTGEVLRFDLSFSILRFTDGIDSFEMSGTMSFEGSIATITMNFRDNNTGETFRVEDYTVVDSFGAVTISGRFYHSEYGYVDISTPIALRFDPADVPESGTILIEGSASAAQATFMTGGNYTLELDENGDGTFDSTQSCTWDGECTPIVI